MNKPDCYKCKFRRDVPGDAHSSCAHPLLKEVINNSMLQILSILGGMPNISDAMVKPKVTGNQHGINHGWFNWPFNFDPIWLESCDSFEPINNSEEKQI